MLWLAVGTFLVSGATPQLTARMGQRAVVRLGLGLEAVAIAGLAVTLSTTVPGFVIGAWLFLYGAGVGMATAQLTSVILVEVPLAESGQASGFQTTVRQLGSALGVALLGGLLVANVTSQTNQRLAGSDLPQAQRDQVVALVHDTVGAGIPSLAHDPATAAAAAAAEQALVHASKVTTGIAAGVLAIGLAATLALPALTAEAAAESPQGQRARRKARPAKT